MDLAELEKNLRSHVEALAATPRTPGSPEHRRAGDYIRDHLTRAGFTVEEDVSREAGVPCRNLLTRPVPDRAGLPLVVLGAHYDTVAGSPGADDNASGVASLLELARCLPLLRQAAGSPRARLQLAAYDLEEYGLIGSGRHCQRLKAAGTEVRGMVSLEMLGFTAEGPGSQHLPPQLARLYPDVANFIGVVGNEASHALLDTLTQALKTINDLPVEFLAVPADGRAIPETRLSDHASFWDRGYPALMITDTSFFRNPHYHKATDTAATLDYPFLARVTAGVCEAAWRVLQA